MKIFTTCINGVGSVEQYLQGMISDIAHQLGFKIMGIYVYDSKEESDDSLRVRHDGIIASISKGDIVFFQYPTGHSPRFEKKLVNRIRAYGGRIIIIIHDIDPRMFLTSRFILGSVVELFNCAEVLIVPSYIMKKILLGNGVRRDMKFIIQEMWDYSTDICFSQTPKFQKEIHFVGNLSKFSFLHQWDFDVPIKVYTSEQGRGGANVQIIELVDYISLLLELAKGGFGLVWYGEGDFNREIRYNNSFELSAYLAAGIPVIVPRSISNRYLIEKNCLGLVVDSLDEAVAQVKGMEETDYQEYARHVKEFSPLIRNGYFTKKFLIDAVQMLMRKDIDHYIISNMPQKEISYGSVFVNKAVHIMDMQETLEYVKDRKISLARFGDGEIYLMTGESIEYQDYDEELDKRLKQIIMMPDNEKLLVCIPDIFEKRERYNTECNSYWDNHFKQYQGFYDEIFSNRKFFGSSFFSRPYIDLVDKTISGKYFAHMKDLFADKDILIVEGIYSRSGVGNDLFQGAKSIKRIICPAYHAYDKYREILDTIRRYGTNTLILLMLGPTAKVLACDLAFEGYWAIDIGHIDSEYEWYKMGAKYRIELKNKHTAEFNYDENIEIQNDEQYAKEVVAILSDR